MAREFRFAYGWRGEGINDWDSELGSVGRMR